MADNTNTNQKKVIFNGHKKVGHSILREPERKFVNWLTPKVPKCIETYHLTLMSIPISILIIFFSWLAIRNIHWLWGVSAMIALQWVTDCLDGSVGRARETGLIKWGYYMDHFLDYFFLASILIGYLLIIPEQYDYIKFFLFAIFVGFMINSYLSFAITNEFRISYFGISPTEIRLACIIINSLIVVVYHEQKKMWILEMKNKESNSNNKNI